jgi:hypothetical protein
MTNQEVRELARLIDLAINSDDPNVRRALSRLMTMVALIEEADSYIEPGPFEELVNYIDQLSKRIRELEIKEQQRELPFSKYMDDWN